MRPTWLPPRGPVARALLLALTLSAAGCVESRTVFQQPNLTAGVPAAARGFLGYMSASDTATHQTVCGNCHVERQAQ